MGDAKLVDLDALRSIGLILSRGDYLAGNDDTANTIRNAIAEIEAARAMPSPPPISPETTVTLGLARAVIDAAQALVQASLAAVAEMRERGPSRAERLVAYRCAALRLAWNDDPPASPGHIAKGAEEYAHAMLAAEREPTS